MINNENINLTVLGLENQKKICRNLSVELLVDDIIKNKEGIIGPKGSVLVDTGVYTGRSPKDKYIVEESSSKDKIWWGEVNKKISNDIFDILYKKVIQYYRAMRAVTCCIAVVSS